MKGWIVMILFTPMFMVSVLIVVEWLLSLA